MAKRFPLQRQRLLSGDYARIYKHGRRAQGSCFSVVVLENELGRTRFGLSVAKRHAKLAVNRNFVRRVFRESFRLAQGELPVGVDIVMIATLSGLKPELALVRSELVQQVARALRKKARVAREAPRSAP